MSNVDLDKIKITLKGLQKLTLLDFPGRLACTVFVGGCNLRCPFCHNASLVLPERFGKTLPTGEFFSFLEARRGKLEGVCVSGGEPTLYRDLPHFIGKIKELGFAVKLDTNGTNPDMLSRLISEGLLDYVAMDIKNSPASYPRTVGIEDFDLSGVLRSADILMKGSLPFEFRTTLVRELHTEKDIEAIGEWLRGDEAFFLQTFTDSGDLVGSHMSGYSAAETENLLRILSKFVPSAQIRG